MQDFFHQHYGYPIYTIHHEPPWTTMNHPMHLQGHLHCTAGAFRLGDGKWSMRTGLTGKPPPPTTKKWAVYIYKPDLVCRWHKPAKLRKIFIIDYRHDMIWYTVYMVRMLIPCRLYDHIQSHFCGMPTWASEVMPNANPVMTRWNKYPRVSGFNLASSNWQILINTSPFQYI